MKEIDLGFGELAQWTGVDADTGVPYIAYASPEHIEDDELPEDATVVRYYSSSIVEFHIARLIEFRDYLKELEGVVEVEPETYYGTF